MDARASQLPENQDRIVLVLSARMQGEKKWVIAY
jgi:hypothetical protein